MNMHNPPHPGEFIRDIYMMPFNLSVRAVANALDVAPSTINRLLNGLSNVTPEMALRLSRVFGRSAESWLSMQNNYSLWQAKQKVDLKNVTKMELEPA